MQTRTVYLDLDHAGLSQTREGIEIRAVDDVVIMSGSRAAFAALGEAIATWDPARIHEDGEL